MSLTILRGPPGAGKSTYLVELVEVAIRQDRTVGTFASSENPHPASLRYGLLGSRVPGLTCALDYIVSTPNAMEVLDRLPVGTLAVFDEAYRFGPQLAKRWLTASARGVEVVAATPSDDQMRLLARHEYVERSFSTTCQRCLVQEATTAFVDVSAEATQTVCTGCEEEIRGAARADILERLQRQGPYPGERAIYQPVELTACADWRVLRPDSPTRFELMAQLVAEAGLSGDRTPAATYLDVGCNTGYFCHRMSQLGFTSEGVDLVGDDIQTARLLDTYFRRNGTAYVVADAHAYLQATRDVTVDVTSAFAVFQWVITQTTLERGVDCFEALFAKTGRLCLVEIGYASEPQYADLLPPQIDRSWVFGLMADKGGFSEIRMYDATQHGLMFGSRDLFVGIK